MQKRSIFNLFFTSREHKEPLSNPSPDRFSPLGGVELVRRKVKCLYVMGGVFGEAEEGDYNFSGYQFRRVILRPVAIRRGHGLLAAGGGATHRLRP